MVRRVLFGVLFVSAFVMAASGAQASKIEQSTYYTVPDGKFETLKATNASFATAGGKVSIGNIDSTAANVKLDVNGGYIYGEMESRVISVQAPNTQGIAAVCAADEQVISGGVYCSLGGMIFSSRPVLKGEMCATAVAQDGWCGDCVGSWDVPSSAVSGINMDLAVAETFVICSKK